MPCSPPGNIQTLEAGGMGFLALGQYSASELLQNLWSWLRTTILIRKVPHTLCFESATTLESPIFPA